MKIQFQRVTSVHARHPFVVAHAGHNIVRWRPRNGWTCDCGTPACPHITAVRQLTHPEVTGEHP